MDLRQQWSSTGILRLRIYRPLLQQKADAAFEPQGSLSQLSVKSSHSERPSDPRNVSPGSLVSLLAVRSVADAHETGEHQSRVASAC